MLMQGFHITEKSREEAAWNIAAFRNVLYRPPLYQAIMDCGRDV
ncbi:hypothetical protein Q672_01985 [Marinobacter sp. EVN1]|nr:hypothetical protein Q672_01985 [Marinobacter sp. EVN1]